MSGVADEASGTNPIAYAPRRVVECGTVEGRWTAKLYAILSERWDEGALPSPEAMAAAVREAMEELDAPLDHPLGFAIFHLANDGIYLLLTRFNNANNLRHRVFSAALGGEPLRLEPLGDAHIIACVWEMRLMKFEADAWIDCVLKPGLTPETAARYLGARYQGWV